MGSVFEEEDERGLAHFIEHMVFRGTESYSDGEVVSYLESIGASFGADTNAYTSYDETVYMLQIPIEKEENLEKAFSILSEFAMKAAFCVQQLETEKGIILDELRLYESTAASRLSRSLIETILDGTLYANRHPIGLESVIKGCTYEKIKSFYSKWYRPENMAVVAVGDFSSDQVMGYVNRYFATLPVSEKKRELECKKQEIFPFKTSFSKTYKDPETTGSYFVIGSRFKRHSILTKEDVKEFVVDALIVSMANRRLDMKVESSDPPFKLAVYSLSQIVRSGTVFTNTCVCWDEDPLKGLEALMFESKKIRKQGFTQHELDIAIAKFRSSLKVDLENSVNHKNSECVVLYLEHFMRGDALYSFKENATLRLECLDQIKLCDVNERRFYFFDQELAAVYLPSEKSPEISEDHIIQLISEKEDDVYTSNSEEMKYLDLESSFEKGSILETQVFENTQVKKLLLSNGMNVYLEPSNLKENLFSFALKAEKGWDMYDSSLFPSASIACSYLAKSGLAGLSAFEIKDALVGKNIGLEYDLDITSRNIRGESSNEDMATVFKLIHSIFTDRTYRQDAWNQEMKIKDEFFAIKDANPDIKFHQAVNRFNYKDHYFFEFYNSKSMDKTTAEFILTQIFNNPAEFTLVVVGDYDEVKLRDCLERYLASIPCSDDSQVEKLVKSFEFPEGVHYHVLDNAGVGQESRVVLTYPVQTSQFNRGFKDFYDIVLAENIINTRLLKKLRSEEGETYGVQAGVSVPFYPNMTSVFFQIHLSTSVGMVDKMTKMLLEEITRILDTPPTLEEKQKAIEIHKHKVAKRLQDNEGKIDRIQKNLAFGIEPFYFISEKYEEPSIEYLHEVMKALFNMQRYTLHTKLPIKNDVIIG